MNKIILLSCSFMLSLSPTFAQSVRVEQLRCEHMQNPIGIGVQQPRLSWKLRSNRIGEVQTAYQLRAASSAAGLKANKPDLWDSSKITSDQSVLVPWAGKPLTSRSQVFWQVRVWSKDNRPSPWSDTASFELGLLNASTEWKGRWITADLPRYDIKQSVLAKSSWINAGSVANQAAAVRFVLDLPAGAGIRSAAIDAAADGLITIYVNGQPTRQGSSSRTAPVHADVRSRLAPGKNVIAIGSAAVRNAIRRDSGATGRNAIAAHGFAELENGRRIEFDTDGSWRAAVAPSGDWFMTAFDDSAWTAATVLGSYVAQPSKYADNTIGPGRYVRKNFTTKGPIARARLYATALGVYEASINGRRVSGTRLDPGWTDYTKRVMVQTFDVTKLLSPGKNTLGAVTGDGWYAGRLGWMGLAQYGTRPVFAAQLEITYGDGSTDVIATDDSWRGGSGEIVASDQQWGEILDARKAADGWDQPLFDDRSWTRAVVEEHTTPLVPQLGPPVRKLLELAPKKITRLGGAWVVDLGQNMVGHVRLFARGPAGTTITLRHGEMLNPDGSLYTENLRPALSTDTFILKGAGREAFEPHFTFHGFRYVEVTGYPGTLTADDLRGIVVGSDTPKTGTFECSNPDLNRLYRNIVWGQRGNFLSVPTDCPQRDERMGWMGDAQVFAPTATCNTDVSGFFTKWMVDVNDGQTTNGDYSDVSPRIARPAPAWPVWGDAGVIIPWVMYTAYGDKAFLADNYPFMVRWVDHLFRASNNLILTGGVGDHLAPRMTPINIVDTAYFANSAHVVAKAAAVLGKTEDAAKYDKLFHDVADAFNNAFVGPDGSITAVGGGFGRGRAATPPASAGPGGRVGNTQTAYILALQFDLLPEHLRPVVAQRLAQDVEQNGHLTTGFVGVGLICPTLAQIGRSDLAWQLVFADTYPSWLFSVKNGATTIWERWDGWTPERGFQDSSMNSFNHYSLGSVGAWFYSGAAGIQLDESRPGYKHFFLRPQFTTRLSYLKTSLDSPYGMIRSAWERSGDRFTLKLTVPPNTTATLELRGGSGKALRKSHRNITPNKGVLLEIRDDAIDFYELVAGDYTFTTSAPFVREQENKARFP
jgi:alpha-L-rhamnosidase